MVWLPYVRQSVCNAYISRGFCPFGFPLKHTIAAYAFRFYLENGIVFKRSFGAFGGSILRTCHFCLRYCIHCTVVAWAEYTLYLERFFRFFGYPFLIIIPISRQVFNPSRYRCYRLFQRIRSQSRATSCTCSAASMQTPK